MTTLTLEQIHAEHERRGALIATLQAAAPAAPTQLYTVPEAQIELRPGERYAGLVLGADGSTSHHLVLLPGSAQDVTWQAAQAWAAEAGGEMPTRQEQALLFANLRGEFEPAWYWSSQEHEESGSHAWGQGFGGGGVQSYGHKSYEGRARAVRRFAA